MRIGAIRWDSYYETKKEEPLSPPNQVAHALSPAQYHWIAPFFARVTPEGEIGFGPYTMDIFEKEAEYAVWAGIDYFAYCWYRDNDLLSTARKYHLTSKFRDRLAMCAILGVTRMDDVSTQQLYDAMREPFYVRLFGNRPLVFVFGGVDADKEGLVKTLRSGAAAAGITDPLFVVAMYYSPDSAIVQRAAEWGYDGISSYGVACHKADEPYMEGPAATAEKRNRTCAALCKQEGLSLIPNISMGFATRPRVERPCTWSGDYGKRYAHWGTPDEIAAHAEKELAWASSEQSVADQTVLLYAWNEHDEGGWICPTLTVDESGAMQLDSSGNPIPNTKILNAVSTVFRQY